MTNPSSSHSKYDTSRRKKSGNVDEQKNIKLYDVLWNWYRVTTCPSRWSWYRATKCWTPWHSKMSMMLYEGCYRARKHQTHMSLYNIVTEEQNVGLHGDLSVHDALWKCDGRATNCQALWLYELVTEQQPLWRSMKLFDCNKTLDYDTEVVFEQENIRLEHRRN